MSSKQDKSLKKIRQKELFRKFYDFSLNEGVSVARLDKIKSNFITLERGISKPFEEVTRVDVEDFISRLNRNEFLTEKGKPYSGSSKSDYKKLLKLFFKWFKGNGEFYPEQVSWIGTKIAKHEKPDKKPVLTQEQVLKLAAKFKKVEDRVLTLALFDSGFRWQEIDSSLKKDLTFDDYGEDKCFWLNCNKSKTVVRNVPLTLFSGEIKTYFESSVFTSLKDSDKLFPVSYTNYVNRLKNYSQELFGLKITPHCLRHSSATLYAELLEGDVFALMSRYGWKKMEMANTYVRESKSAHKRSAQKVFKIKVLDQEKRISKLEEDNENLKTTINFLIKNMSEELKEKIKPIRKA